LKFFNDLLASSRPVADIVELGFIAFPTICAIRMPPDMISDRIQVVMANLAVLAVRWG
jgi:hypothetical protein